jgi:integration host factor subunit beta
LGSSSAPLGGDSVVTKKDIVKAISEQIGMTQLKTKEIVQKTFDAIIDTLVREERIELRNFGVFEVKKRAARKEMEERVKLLEKQKAEEKARAAALEAARSEAAQASPSTVASPVSSGNPQPADVQTLPLNHQNSMDTSHREPPPASGTGF